MRSLFLFFLLGEARKQFKTYVNILSTIKNEHSEKYLILRKKYINVCPVEEKDDDFSEFGNSELLQSPGSRSGISEYDVGPSTGNRLHNDSSIDSESQTGSPYRAPPPYKPPPKVLPYTNQNQQQYKEVVDEYKLALSAIGIKRTDSVASEEAASIEPVEIKKDEGMEKMNTPPEIPPKQKQGARGSLSRDNSMDDNDGVQSTDVNENKENVPVTPVKPEHTRTLDKQISVKEATKKFNRIASEEEASKITSPPGKKKPEKVSCLLCVFFFLVCNSSSLIFYLT